LIADSKWTVAFNRSVYVTFDVSTTPNKLDFLAADLSEIDSVAILLTILVPWLTPSLESTLSQGVVPSLISALLPPLAYTAAHSSRPRLPHRPLRQHFPGTLDRLHDADCHGHLRARYADGKWHGLHRLKDHY